MNFLLPKEWIPERQVFACHNQAGSSKLIYPGAARLLGSATDGVLPIAFLPVVYPQR